MLWLRLHFRRLGSSAAAQSPALIPIASKCPERLPPRSSDNSPPAPEYFRGRPSVPAKKAFGQRRDRLPSPPEPSRLSPQRAALRDLLGNAIEVPRPGPATEPARPACRRGPIQQRRAPFSGGIEAACGNTRDRNSRLEIASREHLRIGT